MNRVSVFAVTAFAMVTMAVTAPGWLSQAGGHQRAVPRDSSQNAPKRGAPANQPAGQRAVPRHPQAPPAAAPGDSDRKVPERKPANPPAEGRAVPRSPQAPQAVPRERERPEVRSHYGPGLWPPFYYGPYSPWFYPYGYPYPPYGYWYGVSYGGVRLEIDRKEAAVYVDGYYAGIVDDFDGLFQRLTLTVGRHRLEICAAGFETLAVDVDIQPARTITYRLSMVPIR